MYNKLLISLLLSLMVFDVVSHCGDRLERALDLMQQRRNSARRRYVSEDSVAVYRHRLRSAPIDVSVTKLMIEIPDTRQSDGRDGFSWAKVERCSYEPSNNSIRTRVALNELAVTGLVQLVTHESSRSLEDLVGGRRGPLPAESCRINLRIRRAGMEFYTSPIARGRGQMRIRTESSFLEPRFVSIYAYGCRALVKPAPVLSHDRIESEPRKRELADSVLVELTNGDSNFVSNSTYDEDDIAEEENRLGASLTPISGSNSNSVNDALLDSLWRSRSDITREMEDVFLRSASQAITHYIEKQLHPAIKETLMLSMGYTISYG